MPPSDQDNSEFTAH